jgi:nitrate reductase NapE component
MSTLSYHHNTPAPKKSNKVWIIVVIVLVVLCCLCAVVVVGGFGGYQFLRSSGTGIGDMFESNPSGQTSTGGDSDDQMQASTDIPAPSIQLPNLFGVELGDEMRCEPCGFSYKKVPGYTFNNDWEVLITMTAPGADEKIGPLILLAGGVPDEGFTQDGLVKAMKDTPLTYSNQKSIKVDGVSAVSLDASGTLEGVEIKGRSVGALVTPKQMFTIAAFAPADKWEELRPYFEAVLDSISFFEPVPAPTETVEP